MIQPNLRIAYISREQPMVSPMKIRLESKGYQVVTLSKLSSVLGFIYSDPPDIIIADLPAADDDMRALLNDIEEDSYFSIIPIIGLIDESIEELFDWDRLPLDDFVTYPINYNELFSRIQLAFKRIHRVFDNNPLTKLPGNTSIQQAIVKAIGKPMAVCYIDINNFKPYNDAYGFSRGDEVIRMLARIMANVVKESGEGGIGVIAANAIGVLESDYYTNSRAANLRALRREIRKAKEKTTGLIGVNIMVAVNDFHAQLEVAIEEKVDAVFLGAGLPIKGIPVEKLRSSGVALVPIVSSRRAAELIFKYWAKTYNDIPDAVVVEGPLAGGHLGFSEEDLNDPDLKLETIVTQVVEGISEFRKTFQKDIPVIAAGGIFTGNDIYKFLQLGAQGVQMATRFVATDECDADIRFKEAFVNCRREDIAIIKSPVGMPGRAIYNTFLRNADAGIRNASRCAWRCLRSCDIKHANFCISDALDNARQGNLDKGFVFCGANAFRVDKIVPVRELITNLKWEYEAEWINELVTLKDEYLGLIERGFIAVRKEYERSTQRLGRLRDEYGKTLERKISNWKDEYDKALEAVNLIKRDYEYALMKLNELMTRFPERIIELKAITKRF